jgi:hypothetical protein
MPGFLRPISILLLPALLLACTTDRVSTEFGTLNETVTAADKQITPLLKPKLEEARQQELTISAQAGDPWFLSDGCRVLLNDTVALPSSSCSVTHVPLGERPPLQTEATAVRRKLDVLTAYVGALELLMDASSDSAITESYATALAAFGDLGNAAKARELIDFVAKRQRQTEQKAIEEVVPAVIASLRYNRMRSVVTASNSDVVTLARELQLHLVNLGLDKDGQGRTIGTRLTALNTTNEAVLTFDTSNAVGYRAAIVKLQAEQKAFMKFYQKTSVYKIGLVAEVHGALDKALRNPGSVEDMVGYLETLKSLIETVEG